MLIERKIKYSSFWRVSPLLLYDDPIWHSGHFNFGVLQGDPNHLGPSWFFARMIFYRFSLFAISLCRIFGRSWILVAASISRCFHSSHRIFSQENGHLWSFGVAKFDLWGWIRFFVGFQLGFFLWGVNKKERVGQHLKLLYVETSVLSALTIKHLCRVQHQISCSS